MTSLPVIQVTRYSMFPAERQPSRSLYNTARAVLSAAFGKARNKNSKSVEVPRRSYAALATTNNALFDALYNDVPDTPSIDSTTTDVEAVELLQEVLRNHGFRNIPGMQQTGGAFGVFGPKTRKAVLDFKRRYNEQHPGQELANANMPVVDAATLRALVDWQEGQTTPSPTRVYLSHVMRLPDPSSVWVRVASMISSVEGDSVPVGTFRAQRRKEGSWSNAKCPKATKCVNATQCDNSASGGCAGDHAGASYGIFQWTHKNERLLELLGRCADRSEGLFSQVFVFPPVTVEAVLEHFTAAKFTERTAQGVVRPEYADHWDLHGPAWKERFDRAARTVEFQRCQLDQAVADLHDYYQYMKGAQGYATLLTSEREVAYWLDLTNQMGKQGARDRYTTVVNTLRAALGRDPTGAEILEYQTENSSYPERREFFGSVAPLSDDPFPEA